MSSADDSAPRGNASLFTIMGRARRDGSTSCLTGGIEYQDRGTVVTAPVFSGDGSSVNAAYCLTLPLGDSSGDGFSMTSNRSGRCAQDQLGAEFRDHGRHPGIFDPIQQCPCKAAAKFLG